MPPVEAWEKVLVDADFVTSTHGELGCRACHGGPDGVLEKDEAHQDVVADPSAGDAAVCQTCHATIVADVMKSLHATQQGYHTAFTARSGLPATDATYQQMFTARCATCHATCGQCHVSRPVSVEGGLVSEHAFRKMPSQTENCTACHGSRVGDEFRGRNSGVPEDVHYLNGMNCMSCHDDVELHGDGTTPTDRYHVEGGPACATCHADANSASASLIWHSAHAGKVACQVCHSESYKNCYSCHVQLDSQGLDFPSEMDFRIGRNPAPTTQHPHDYVVVRHVPIVPDTFAAWDLELPDYASVPTWRLATPHNIQKNTSQTESCNTCHGSLDLFLTSAYIEDLITSGLMVDDEVEANESVVVDEPPEMN